MKRDMDLVRKILLTIEAGPQAHAPSPIVIEGYDAEAIEYHVYLMFQGGLVEGVQSTGLGDPSPSGLVTSITWKGHEFLDAARQDTIWNKAKAAIAKVGGATYPVWLETLTKFALEQIT